MKTICVYYALIFALAVLSVEAFVSSPKVLNPSQKFWKRTIHAVPSSATCRVPGLLFRHTSVGLLASASGGADLKGKYDNVILYDGVCNFCNAWVDIILRVDFQKKFRFAALQSSTGMMLLERIGRQKNDISSVILVKSNNGSNRGGDKGDNRGDVDDYKGYQKSDAVVEVLKELGIKPLSFTASVIAIAMPRPLKDGIYDQVARNRHVL